MNKTRLITYLVIAAVVIVALIRGIILGDPADMRVEASGL